MIRTPLRPLARILSARAKGENPDAIERENLRDRFIRLFGATDMHRATEAMNEAGSRLGRYLLMQLLINVSYGTLFGLALFAIGVPNAQLWGLLGMVLRFIPYVGAPISLLFPLGLTLAADSGWAMPLYTLLAFIAIETTCAYVLEPYLFGASTGLSRVALIAATALEHNLPLVTANAKHFAAINGLDLVRFEP